MSIKKMSLDELKNCSYEDLKDFFEKQLMTKKMFDEWEKLKNKNQAGEKMDFWDNYNLTQLDNHFKNYVKE